jgi:putative Holliday junction resolvase
VRVGLAVSDETRTISQPHSTLVGLAEPALLEAIARVVREQEVVGVVVGLPLRMSGERGPEAEQAAELGRLIAAETGLAVGFCDERLTTRQAEKEMLARGSSRQRRREAGDRVAAALLLQTVLAGGRVLAW